MNFFIKRELQLQLSKILVLINISVKFKKPLLIYKNKLKILENNFFLVLLDIFLSSPPRRETCIF